MISMPFLSRLAGPIVLLLTVGTLTACSVEVDERPGGYNPRPPQLCTREYAPVCGERGRDRQTFANACEARSSGYGIIGRGECQFRRPDRDQVGWQDQGRDGWSNDGRNRPDRDRNRNDRDRRDRDRDDRGDRGDRERPRDQRACTMEYNPVCGRRGTDFKEFGNACSAQAAGFSVYRAGQCPVR
ncbi:Kazal-type serine protease inhibitor [Shinella sp. HZN7]|uniref:Kazal-type serine protease inhibitor family protein n=1 Tax=Shinella sp. (strain HZN7) TaxID=879274 RepID=UPI0009FC568A|nr:Kazal-type serine protease inhibitor [Shinella sp. HZN7]